MKFILTVISGLMFCIPSFSFDSMTLNGEEIIKTIGVLVENSAKVSEIPNDETNTIMKAVYVTCRTNAISLEDNSCSFRNYQEGFQDFTGEKVSNVFAPYYFLEAMNFVEQRHSKIIVSSFKGGTFESSAVLRCAYDAKSNEAFMCALEKH